LTNKLLNKSHLALSASRVDTDYSKLETLVTHMKRPLVFTVSEIKYTQI